MFVQLCPAFYLDLNAPTVIQLDQQVVARASCFRLPSLGNNGSLLRKPVQRLTGENVRRNVDVNLRLVLHPSRWRSAAGRRLALSPVGAIAALQGAAHISRSYSAGGCWTDS